MDIELEYLILQRIKIVYYNTKLCLEKDALTISKLKDLKSLEIARNEYQDVFVNKNWLSDTFTCYYSEKSINYFTYASNLNSLNNIIEKFAKI